MEQVPCNIDGAAIAMSIMTCNVVQLRGCSVEQLPDRIVSTEAI